MKFGVVGDAVNLASRMEGLCKVMSSRREFIIIIRRTIKGSSDQ